MNGHVIPDTPIAVDFWKIRDCPNARIFFLTHLHGDHTVGLTSSWQHDIYCSEVTGKLLKVKYDVKPSLIKTLEVGSSTIVYLDTDHQAQMCVTAIDANHCPGAVMFLFEGYFGKILYTGDFRFHEQMHEDPVLRNLSDIDVLYLDNTYCSPRCVFPTREETVREILSLIKDNSEADIVLGLRSLGKEDLLLKIAEETQEWISVPTQLFRTAEILEFPDVLHTEEWDSRIRVVQFYSISNKNLQNWNQTRPTIAILPTALYTGLDMTPFANQDKVFVVPYSDHSSYPELLEFIKMVKPKIIHPIVPENTKGPFGVCIRDRADMSCFLHYVSREARHTFEIPASVKRWMSAPLKMNTTCTRKRKRVTLQKRPSKSKVKGVIFEESDNEDNCKELEHSPESKRKSTSSNESLEGQDNHKLEGKYRSTEVTWSVSQNDKQTESQNDRQTTKGTKMSHNSVESDDMEEVIVISDDEAMVQEFHQNKVNDPVKDLNYAPPTKLKNVSVKSVSVKILGTCTQFTSCSDRFSFKKDKTNMGHIHPPENVAMATPSVVSRTPKKSVTEVQKGDNKVRLLAESNITADKEKIIHVYTRTSSPVVKKSFLYRKISVKPIKPL